MSKPEKEVLFRLTEKDFVFTYSKGTGPGGQKRNKTSSKVQCLHPPSGAIGVSDETRSQHQNKSKAFVKMAESEKFKKWWRLECARRTGALLRVEEAVEEAMRPENISVEVKQDGKWTDWDKANIGSDDTEI